MAQKGRGGSYSYCHGLFAFIVLVPHCAAACDAAHGALMVMAFSASGGAINT